MLWNQRLSLRILERLEHPEHLDKTKSNLNDLANFKETVAQNEQQKLTLNIKSKKTSYFLFKSKATVLKTKWA